MTADINHLKRLEHETHEQWKDRLLNIDSVADSIKDSNTIEIASSVQRSANKNKRESGEFFCSWYNVVRYTVHEHIMM